MRFSVSLMSKKTFGVFTILVFLLSLTGNVLADNTITTIHGNSENLGEFTSLALDNSAIPHISYYNSDNGNIYVLTCSNPQCTPFLVARPIDTGTRSSLELNNNGFPVLSYESNGDLKIAVCQDATCLAKTTKILASTGDVGYHNSLELDSSGYPVISYYDATNTSLNLTYCISQPDCSSGIIINREIDNSASVGIYSSLALNSSGFPVISYYDETNGDLKLAVCSDATCVNKATVTVDSAGIVGTYISLALNSNDYPVISYYDNTNSQLKIAVCGNTTCTSGNNITTLDNTVTSGIDSSVALNNNGYPVVSYQNLANRDLKIARCGNSTCSSGNIITTLDAPGDVGGYTSLAINNNNEPVISYFDDSNNNLKLAIADIISPTITLNERASANPSSANSVNFNVAFSETVQNVDVNDFTLTTTGVSGASITSVTLGAFYYTVSVNTGSGNGTIRLDVPNTASIKDLSNNDLSGLPFTSGEVYTIDKSGGSLPTSPTFGDVPMNHPYWGDIEILYANGLTAGCSTSAPLLFCPDVTMNRAQSAVFMVRGNFGTSYSPPAAPWTTFGDDFSPGTWAQPWAQGMFDAGLTAGCSNSPRLFCPWEEMPRFQAAVFGIRLRYGNSYPPPAGTGTVFADIDGSEWYAGWAEQAYSEGLLPACGSSGGKPLFCPNDLVPRGLAAYMIVRAKNLSMP